MSAKPTKPPGKAGGGKGKKVPARGKGKQVADSILGELEDLREDLKRKLTPALERFEKMKVLPAPKPSEGLGFKTRTGLDDAFASGKPTVAQRGVVRPDEDLGKPPRKVSKPDAVKPKVKTPVKPRVVKAKVKPPVLPKSKPPVKPLAVAPPKTPVPAKLPAPRSRTLSKVSSAIGKIKFSPKIKARGTLIIDIALGIFFSWLDSKTYKRILSSMDPDINKGVAAMLEEESSLDRLSKFRKGEDMSEGYQLYAKVLFKLGRYRTSDVIGLTSPGVEYTVDKATFFKVILSNGRAEDDIPEFTSQWDTEDGHFYIELFEDSNHGIIKPGTNDAAHERYASLEKLFKIIIPTFDVKQYLKDFYNYTILFDDSKAALTFADYSNNINFKKNLTGMGMYSVFDLLYKDQISFPEIMDTVPWYDPSDKIKAIEAVYNLIDTANLEPDIKAAYIKSYKSYFDLLKRAKRDCLCHTNPFKEPPRRLVEDRGLW